jgi:hypothetical protein
MDSSISRPRTLSAAGKLNVAGLVAAAAGIVIQIVSGADYPTIPPGTPDPYVSSQGWRARQSAARALAPPAAGGNDPSCPSLLRGMPQPWCVHGVTPQHRRPGRPDPAPVVLEGEQQ